MTAQIITPIQLENLSLNLENPRHGTQLNQRDAIAAIAMDHPVKLFNLAEDIINRGLNPSELLLVILEDTERSTYTVLEGNRRIAALKLASSPQLAASIMSRPLASRFRNLYNRAGSAIPTVINCAVTTPEDAKHWIQLKHTGENEGVGVVPWDGVARKRFRGASPVLQAIQMVEDSDLISDETRENLRKIPYSNIERLVETKEVRDILGLDIKGDELLLLGPAEEALRRLAIIVSDVANRKVKVSHIDTKAQRVAYAQQVADMPLPTNKVGTGSTEETAATTKSRRARPVSPSRKTLIPPNFIVKIHHPRINKIYHELQKLIVEDFVNCSAVTLRVFLELSIDYYADKNNISLKVQPKAGSVPASAGGSASKAKDVPLPRKMFLVTQYLEDNNICDRLQLQGIRNLQSNIHNVLSVETLHAYVHNKDYSPIASELKTTWDNIEPFVRALWS